MRASALHVDKMATPGSGLGDLGLLPEDFLEFVILRLDNRSILRLSAASSNLREICQQEPIWQRICMRDACGQLQYKGSWQATALSTGGIGGPGLRTAWLPRRCTQSQYNRYCRCHMNIAGLAPDPQAPAIGLSHGTAFSKQDMRTDGPKVLLGLMSDWRAMRWLSPGALRQHFDAVFKIAKPGGGNTLMTLQDYLSYAAVQRDEEPLYIFDHRFGESAPSMLEDYSVPEPFQEDLFEPLGSQRPDFRWLIMGPMRSGSSWHYDPSFTSAWNSLIAGYKRWAFYPPGCLPPGVTPLPSSPGEEDFHSPSPLRWYLEVYPTLAPEERPLEVVQKPGETIFVPARWWHCVLNLSDTVAVTQNFVPRANLEATMRELAWGTHASAWLAERAEDTGAIEPTHDHAKIYRTAAAGLDCGLIQDDSVQQGPPWGPLGFARSRVLGPWLQSLWDVHPDLQPRILVLSEKYASIGVWRRRLAACCPATVGHLGPHFPVSGGPTVLFRVDNTFCKFYTHVVAERNVASWTAEAAALRAIAACDRLQQYAPRLIKAGLLPPDDLSPVETPFLVMSACPGSSLASRDLPVDAPMAASLGRLIEDIHGLQSPAAAERSCSPRKTSTDSKQCESLSGSKPAVTQPYTFFNDADGQIWRWPRESSDEAEKPAGSLQKAVSNDEPARPFKAFLRSRRRTVIKELAVNEVLPRHLHAQLEAYLPTDPAALLPEGLLPTWVHGDLTHGNILALDNAPGEAVQLHVIDFGDSGLGDPLWDLVPLHIVILRCKPELLQSFLAAYRMHAAATGGAVWLESSEQLSCRAMCYTLLHEQDLLKSAFKKCPSLCNATSLEHLQSLLWGVLET